MPISISFSVEVFAEPPTPPAKPTGKIRIRYTNDGGNNWSNWRNIDSGDTGDFLRQLVVRRLGMARHRIWEIMDTSPSAQDVLAASIIVESE